MLYLVYAGIAGLATIVSGLLPLHLKVSGIGTRYIVAFASGVVVSTALFEMIPESNPSSNWIFLGLGFFLFYIVERVVMIHYCGEGECEPTSISWLSVIGISVDNFIDGMAIALGYLNDPMLGLFITLAVVVHEVPQGLTTSVVMKSLGYSLKTILSTLFFAAVLYPAGSFLPNLFPVDIYEPLIGIVAGEFMYIGAGELLPEAHRRFNVKVVAMVILGALMIYILELSLA